MPACAIDRTARRGLIWLLFDCAVMTAAQAAEPQSVDGEVAFNNSCRTCHTWKAGDNRLGPNLHGIIGRKAGDADGFAYSDLLKKSGLTWDEATLEKFITNPDSVIAGNNMKPYTGITDGAVLKGIIAFLKSNPK